jgi:hypothetical protein
VGQFFLVKNEKFSDFWFGFTNLHRINRQRGKLSVGRPPVAIEPTLSVGSARSGPAGVSFWRIDFLEPHHRGAIFLAKNREFSDFWFGFTNLHRIYKQRGKLSASVRPTPIRSATIPRPCRSGPCPNSADEVGSMEADTVSAVGRVGR